MSTSYAPYVEPPKVPQKMSFFSEEHAANVWRIPNATDTQHAAARRVLATQPDDDQLTEIIFGRQR